MGLSSLDVSVSRCYSKRMKKLLIIGLSLVILVAISFFIFLRPESDEQNLQKQIATSDSATPVESTSYTLEEVSKHSTKEDCWTVIDSRVYDITSYIPRHPGGNNILSACGTDGTAFFNGDQAGELGQVKNHNGTSAERQLEKLLLGDLSQ